MIVGLIIIIILIYLKCKNILNSSKQCLGLTIAIILLIIDIVNYILLYIGISFLARDLKDIHIEILNEIINQEEIIGLKKVL